MSLESQLDAISGKNWLFQFLKEFSSKCTQLLSSPSCPRHTRRERIEPLRVHHHSLTSSNRTRSPPTPPPLPRPLTHGHIPTSPNHPLLTLINNNHPHRTHQHPLSKPPHLPRRRIHHPPPRPISPRRSPRQNSIHDPNTPTPTPPTLPRTRYSPCRRLCRPLTDRHNLTYFVRLCEFGAGVETT